MNCDQGVVCVVLRVVCVVRMRTSKLVLCGSVCVRPLCFVSPLKMFARHGKRLSSEGDAHTL